MTQQSTFTTFKTDPLLRAPLIPLNDSKWIIFGDRDGTFVWSVNIKSNPIKIKPETPIPHHIMLDEDGTPNAVLYNSRFIYSFGGTKHPWILRYDCVKCVLKDLNEKDKLKMANDDMFRISNRAKTELLGDNNILICSRECEVLIYDIKENKFVNCKQQLFENEKKVDMDLLVSLTPYKKHRQTYYFISKTTQGCMQVDMSYGLVVKTKAYSNIFTRDFLTPVLTYVPKDNIILCIGGLKAEGSDEIRIFDLKSGKATKSSIKLPVPLHYHSAVYIESTNCIYVVGGKAKKEFKCNSTGFIIDFKVFKKDMEKIKS